MICYTAVRKLQEILIFSDEVFKARFSVRVDKWVYRVIHGVLRKALDFIGHHLFVQRSLVSGNMMHKISKFVTLWPAVLSLPRSTSSH